MVFIYDYLIEIRILASHNKTLKIRLGIFETDLEISKIIASNKVNDK